jgi:hypothetical protein
MRNQLSSCASTASASFKSHALVVASCVCVCVCVTCVHVCVLLCVFVCVCVSIYWACLPPPAPDSKTCVPAPRHTCLLCTWQTHREAAPVDCGARNLHGGFRNIALEVLEAFK